MSATTFHVEGIPAPQGSKKHVGNGRMVESSKALKPWRERVAWTARECGVPLRLGAVVVRLEFVMPRPVSTPKSRTPPALRKPDIDKLTRGVFDALSGLCFEDDARVVDLRASKRLAGLGEKPGVTVTIADVAEELTA